MLDLNEITIYLKVIQKGSFSQAARALGLPNSTVSHKVSTLERRLGVTQMGPLLIPGISLSTRVFNSVHLEQRHGN